MQYLGKDISRSLLHSEVIFFLVLQFLCEPNKSSQYRSICLRKIVLSVDYIMKGYLYNQFANSTDCHITRERRLIRFTNLTIGLRINDTQDPYVKGKKNFYEISVKQLFLTHCPSHSYVYLSHTVS